MGRAGMKPIIGLVLLPLGIVTGGVGMAITRDDPMWLVFAASLAIATSFVARGNSGR